MVFRVSIFGIFRGVWGPGLLFLLGLGMGACCNFLLRGVLGCPRVLNLFECVSFWGGRGFLEVGVISPNFWGVLLLALATPVGFSRGVFMRGAFRVLIFLEGGSGFF